MRGSEVIRTLGELFERGSRYGIFVIASPENRASAESVFGTKASERGSYWNNCVYGTFKEYINVSEDDSQSGASEASSMICYVGSNGTKTRMYDYSPSTESAWWGKFIELMEDR